MDKKSARELEDAFEAIERALNIIYGELQRLGSRTRTDIQPVGSAAHHFRRLRRQLSE